MHRIYKSEQGEHQVRERYLAFLKHWPVPNEQFLLTTSQGETFIVASGPKDCPAAVVVARRRGEFGYVDAGNIGFCQLFSSLLRGYDRRTRPERSFAPAIVV